MYPNVPVCDIVGISTNQLDPNVGDHEGNTPLAWCVINLSHPRTIEALLKYFPASDPHKKNKAGSSPLLLAYERHQEERKYQEEDKGLVYLQKLLAAPRIQINAYDVESILSQAVFSNNVSVVKELLRAGVDPLTTDETGRSQIQLAEFLGHLEISKLLRGQDARSGANTGTDKSSRNS